MGVITSLQKDIILSYLCDNCTLESHNQGNPNVILTKANITFESLKAILYYFERIGLLSDLNLKYNFISFVLHIEANDLKMKGGFAFQEQILENNLQKLKLELENLKSNFNQNNLSLLIRFQASFPQSYQQYHSLVQPKFNPLIRI
ncbi:MULTISPECIES: hypothetical protein [unclassified Arcicella]|uniref:hypothetical protein n=1 Tax=unclassified Arcicella TaxID=2644986 RepID=UPI00285AF9A7|nr:MULTISPECIES: hypothetical protein [unclassified Arcicella]MDR6561900.1 hypothetical protein [Arcicella sp. BE51]MDR6814046.1 hypothetical protein [Arcicella sp. BE140]MDR6825247.1 hypothetical protein [Arcicella sp. BE139]